jgi:hypothetical protein
MPEARAVKDDDGSRSQAAARTAAALAALRDRRATAGPTLAQRARFAGNGDALQTLRSLMRDPTLQTFMSLELRGMKRSQRAGGVVARAWPTVIRRPDLISATTPVLSRGVLTVYVPSAAVRFALDRVLRAGAETELLRALPVGVVVRRVVIKVGSPPAMPLPSTISDDERISAEPSADEDDL